MFLFGQSLSRDIGNKRREKRKNHYLYAAGIKLRQKTYNNGSLEKQTDYIGNFIYQNTELAFILTDEGRIVPDSTGFAYEYFIKDHLGNTRLVVKDSSGTATLMSFAHYYPFGLEIKYLTYLSKTI